MDVQAQMRDDYESLIKTRPVGRWAETAAILLTYVPQPDFRRLCTKLAKRLDESGMVRPYPLSIRFRVPAFAFMFMPPTVQRKVCS
jgi:hypothetical protein